MAEPLDFEWEGPYRFNFDLATGQVRAEESEDTPWGSTRLTYVLMFSPPYFVDYERGPSAVCYIGKAGHISRIIAHRGAWFQKVAILLLEFAGFEMWKCHPRRQKNLHIFSSVEDDAIWRFKNDFGERPLFNQRGGHGTDIKYSEGLTQRTQKLFALDSSRHYSRSIPSLARRLQDRHG